MTKEREIAISEFKANCLRIVDEVHRRGQGLILTRRGKALARLVPVEEAEREPFARLKGTATIHGDIIEPIAEPWDADA